MMLGLAAPLYYPRHEDEIVQQVLDAANQGFGIGQKQLLYKVEQLYRTIYIPNPFNDNIPGRYWWLGFINRHPEVKLRKTEPLSGVRARNMNPTTVGNYVISLRDVLLKNDLLDKPQYMWNADETSICFQHQPMKVVARSGTKHIPGRVGNFRESMTMMACINGAGMALPPMFVVKGTSFETSEAPKESVFTHQPNAWMEDSLEVEWFQWVFLKRCGTHRCQILIWDSHRSHETLNVILKAKENGILMFTFPPHTTHFLCPLDTTVFGPFQKANNRVL